MLDRRRMLGAAGGLALGGCGRRATKTAAAADGVRMIPVTGGRAWTRRLGAGPLKVLALHGGPGLSHRYLEPLGERLPAAGIELYFHDQLGCGRSDRPTDASLWRLPRFVQEVEQVRRGLGLEDFVLLGHSWGGMLAIEYALAYPQALRGLVISSMAASIAAFVAYVQKIRAAMPAGVQAQLAAFEARGDHTSDAYNALMMQAFNSRYICRLPQFPAPVIEDLQGMNLQLYNEVFGPYDFKVTGNVRDWDRWADLPRIETPALVMGARWDEMDPADIRREGRLVPNARTWISDTGAHLAMWDDPDGYFGALIPFLKSLGPAHHR